MLRALKKPFVSGEKSNFVAAMLSLMQEMVTHSVVADLGEYENFKGRVAKLRRELEDAPDDPRGIAAQVAAALRQYNEKALVALHSGSGALQDLVSALTHAISAVGANGEAALSRLQTVQNQFENAASFQDIREARTRFVEHLERHRDETLRQQTELSEMVSGVIAEFKRIQGRADQTHSAIEKASIYSPDVLTGLSGRAYAEAILADAQKQSIPSYVTLYVVERLEPVTARFGFAVADELMLCFSQHLSQSLRDDHTLFRWGSSSFLTVTVSPAKQDVIRDELQRVASARLEKSISLGSRTALLPISCRHMFLPVAKDIAIRELVEELDGFI